MLTPRHVAFTSTKVPKFAGTTSWEQYRHVFDAIVLSNGWDDATGGDGKGVAAWTRDPSVSTDVGLQSVPAIVSVVLVEETMNRSAWRLASVPVDVEEQMIAGAAFPAGVAECMDSVMLPMMVGAMLPSDVAEQVAR